MAAAHTPSSPPSSAARACPTGPAPLCAVRGAPRPGSVSRATSASEDRASTATPSNARRPAPPPSVLGGDSAFFREAIPCRVSTFLSGRARLAAMPHHSLGPYPGHRLLHLEAAFDCRAADGGGQFSGPVD